MSNEQKAEWAQEQSWEFWDRSLLALRTIELRFLCVAARSLITTQNTKNLRKPRKKKKGTKGAKVLTSHSVSTVVAHSTASKISLVR
jgi:hypothetical protein